MRVSDSGDVMFVVILLLLLVVFDSVFSTERRRVIKVICFGFHATVQPDRKPIGFYFLRVRKLKGRESEEFLWERRRSAAVIVHFSVDLLSLSSTIHDIAEFSQEMMMVVLVQLAARLFPYYSGYLRCHNITIFIC